MPTASKKIVNAWAMYDWANSSYSLTIASAIFPTYYTSLAPERVEMLGRIFDRTALASYTISLSFLIIAFLSPILSSIADYQGNKKSFMKFFCYLGSLSCIAMFFFTKGHIGYGLICSIIASIGFCGSIVFYNAYLPEIAAEEDQDRVSAKGFALGYIGSVIQLIISLTFITLNDTLNWGLGDLPVRIAFLSVGFWWAGFAQITFTHLPRSVKPAQRPEHNILTNGFYELRGVWNQLQNLPILKRFLRSFFFYNMGVQTVMYISVYFASDTLKLKSDQLIITILIIQLVAIFGAYLFSIISKKTSNVFSLSILIFIWIGICIAAYNTYTVNQFYMVAFTVGMVMGGIQSLSRSTYSKLLPETSDTASYFSFYDVCDKIGTVLGTLCFGLVGESLGGMRNSVLALMTFFIIGFVLLMFVGRRTKTAAAQSA
jgi:UMF1 family MFS transporter